MVIAEKDKELSRLQRAVQETRPPLGKSRMAEELKQTEVGGNTQILYCVETRGLNSAKAACTQLMQAALLDLVVWPPKTHQQRSRDHGNPLEN